MRKRQKFVLTTIILTLFLVFFRVVGFEWKYAVAGGAGLLTAVLFAWSLKEGLSGIEWVTLLVQPVVFAVSFFLFTMLVPDDWLVGVASYAIPGVVYDLIPKMILEVAGGILIYLAFGITIYSLLLTENIYSVAAIRTIALLRAAHAVGFIVSVLTAFLAYYTILTFRFSFWWLGALVWGVSLPLFLPGVWSVNLESEISKRVWQHSFWLSAMLAVLAVSVSFWPVRTAVLSLFLCTAFYVFLGITQHHLSQRLFAKTVWEYVTVGGVALVTMLLTSALGI